MSRELSLLGGVEGNSGSGSFNYSWVRKALQTGAFLTFTFLGTFSFYFYVFYFLTVIFFGTLAVFTVSSKHLKLCFSVSILLVSFSA